jgi:hypothetical protein
MGEVGATTTSSIAETREGERPIRSARNSPRGNWSSNVVSKEDHELIERGPYRHGRHPIDSGVILPVSDPAKTKESTESFLSMA